MKLFRECGMQKKRRPLNKETAEIKESKRRESFAQYLHISARRLNISAPRLNTGITTSEEQRQLFLFLLLRREWLLQLTPISRAVCWSRFLLSFTWFSVLTKIFLKLLNLLFPASSFLHAEPVIPALVLPRPSNPTNSNFSIFCSDLACDKDKYKYKACFHLRLPATKTKPASTSNPSAPVLADYPAMSYVLVCWQIKSNCK